MIHFFLKKIFSCSLLLLCLLAQFNATAQDSSRIRISLLTCTPGDELYSIFGHSALRVIDSNSVTDIVYNYGTFNFSDDGFYVKFVRGKLLYYISVASFEDFKYDYQATNRGITEQVLNYSNSEKVAIQHALIKNLREENKYYQYDFFFDNCTTRLRDLIVKSKSPPPLLPSVRPTDMRFRQAIHEYLDKGHQQWSKLGIDILLGARTDRIMTASEQQFLPDNLMMALDSSKNTTMVISSNNLYELSALQNGKDWFTPMVFFLLLFALFVFMEVFLGKQFPLLLTGMDGFLFFCTGMLGILLIFMWVGTDHSMTKNNYNLLWALPTHLFLSFFISANKKWVKQYLAITFVGGLLLLGTWFFLPQQLNVSLIPLVLLLMYRAVTRYNKN